MTELTILGIDPGSRVTGYGLIRVSNSRYFYLASGVIRVVAKSDTHPLVQISEAIAQLVALYHPDEVAIEQVFVHANVMSALKLGEARGAAIAAAITLRSELFEYTARQVKLAAVGYGAAEKGQVQHMVKVILGIRKELIADEADALAIAICHASTRGSLRGKNDQLFTR